MDLANDTSDDSSSTSSCIDDDVELYSADSDSDASSTESRLSFSASSSLEDEIDSLSSAGDAPQEPLALPRGAGEVDFLSLTAATSEQEGTIALLLIIVCLATAVFAISAAAAGEAIRVLERTPNKRRTKYFLSELPKQTASPFNIVFRQRKDEAYYITMGVDVALFAYLLQHFDATLAEIRDAQKDRRGRKRACSASAQLGLVLHWLCSKMPHKVSISPFSREALFSKV